MVGDSNALLGVLLLCPVPLLKFRLCSNAHHQAMSHITQNLAYQTGNILGQCDEVPERREPSSRSKGCELLQMILLRTFGRPLAASQEMISRFVMH
eukprot:1188789-Amphidinium_carterae.1